MFTFCTLYWTENLSSNKKKTFRKFIKILILKFDQQILPSLQRTSENPFKGPIGSLIHPKLMSGQVADFRQSFLGCVD